MRFDGSFSVVVLVIVVVEDEEDGVFLFDGMDDDDLITL
jgi:hypothetical protein